MQGDYASLDVYSQFSVVFIGIHELGKPRFVSFVSRQKKEPIGGGKPRQACVKGYFVKQIAKVVKNHLRNDDYIYIAFNF